MPSPRGEGINARFRVSGLGPHYCDKRKNTVGWVGSIVIVALPSGEVAVPQAALLGLRPVDRLLVWLWSVQPWPVGQVSVNVEPLIL
jgi:hypothetical protein